MTIKCLRPSIERDRATYLGFSLIESMIGMAIFGICFVALLSGMGTTASTVECVRENVRASQILTEKLDTLRLYPFSQVRPDYIQTSFSSTQYPTNDTARFPGIIYTGRVTIAEPPISESYRTKMKLVTVEVSWTDHGRTRRSQMSTLVGEYGMQSYIY
jgi:prepilin-type N-terminal cleavage/methylation domain-containing protein